MGADATANHRLRAPPLAYGYRKRRTAARWCSRAPPLDHTLLCYRRWRCIEWRNWSRLGQRTGGRWDTFDGAKLAFFYTVAFELKSYRRVYESVENRVGRSGVRVQAVIPVGDGL